MDGEAGSLFDHAHIHTHIHTHIHKLPHVPSLDISIFGIGIRRDMIIGLIILILQFWATCLVHVVTHLLMEGNTLFE